MALMLDDLFGSDPDKEKKGKWFWFGEEGAPDAIGFLIARAGGANSKYESKVLEYMRPLQAILTAERNRPSEGTMRRVQEVNRKAFVETCLFDWKNVRTREQPSGVPFSKESAMELFKQYPDLYDSLFSAAQSASTFRDTSEEEEAGN